MNEVTTETTNTEKKTATLPIIVVSLLIIIALAAGGYYLLKNQGETNSPAGDDTLQLEGEGPVARVNGVEISRDEYRRNVEQITASYAAQGIDVSGEEQLVMVKEQALASLINRQLVFAAARSAGISADNQKVENEFQNVLANLGGTEGMAAALAAAGLEESDLRTDLEKSVIINDYLSAKLSLDSITVSDEEVSDYYESVKSSANVEVPPLEEVSEVIKSQLLVEKQQAVIAGEVESLRSGAKIEVLI